jgi:phage shock protein PspC (stress-responsive transcriptional regulator)
MFTITSAADYDKTNYRAAALSMIAGVVHGIATAFYMPQWLGYGVFFIVAALGQIMYGIVLLVKPWQYDETGGFRKTGTGGVRTIYLFGLIMTVAFIVLYLVTRTIGVPLMGPMAEQTEPFDPLGILAQIIHAVLALMLWSLLRYVGRESVNPQTSWD